MHEFTKEELVNEHWLPIKETEGLFEVSDLGRVRNSSPVRKSPVLSVQVHKKTGHCFVSLDCRAMKHRMIVNVCRLVLWTFVEKRPANVEVVHKNGDITDNRLVNLA